MNLDFSHQGEVCIDMISYIKKIIDAFTEKITGVQSTPAGDHLSQVCPPSEAKYLPEDQARAFHHTTARLLFLSLVRRDIQTTVAFLTTRVKHPDQDDWGKLKRVLKYLLCTRSLCLTLLLNLSQILHGLSMLPINSTMIARATLAPSLLLVVELLQVLLQNTRFHQKVHVKVK